MKSANWNCLLCRGFGVIDCDVSRGESRECPACFSVDPDPDPVAATTPGPYSVWHIHGEAHDPEMALCRGNFELYVDAYSLAIDEAKEFQNGRMIVNDSTGMTRLDVPCPLGGGRRIVADRPHYRYAA